VYIHEKCSVQDVVDAKTLRMYYSDRVVTYFTNVAEAKTFMKIPRIVTGPSGKRMCIECGTYASGSGSIY